MLVLAPVMCILSGITVSASLSTYMKYLEGSGTVTNSNESANTGSIGSSGGGKKHGRHMKQSAAIQEGSQRELVATIFVSMVTFFLVTYAFHCVWATSEAYSSPSIVLTARTHGGSRIIFDDFR